MLRQILKSNLYAQGGDKMEFFKCLNKINGVGNEENREQIQQIEWLQICYILIQLYQ